MSRVLKYDKEQSVSGISGWMVTHKLVAFRRIAELIILAVSVILFIVAGYFLFSSRGSANAPLPAGYRVVTPPGDTPRLERIN